MQFLFRFFNIFCGDLELFKCTGVIFAESLYFPSLLISAVTTAPSSIPDNKLMTLMVAILEALITYDAAVIEPAIVALHDHISGF